MAARTGVTKSTIHFYIEKGLLPRPRKVNRTMAYYDESCVERLRLIREFQEKAFLPLGQIRLLFNKVQDGGILENVLAIGTQYTSWLTGGASGRTMSETAVRREFGFTRRMLERLERLGVLHPEMKRSRRVYYPEDVEILRTLVRMRKRGLTPKEGWPTEALTIYVEASHELAKKEVAQLFDRMEKGLNPQDAQNLFNHTGEDIFLSLFLWMRRKAMRGEFAKRVKHMEEVTPATE